MNITLRPIEPGDEAFLYRVYASTREPEMAMTNWTDEQKEAFLRMQFTAQHSYYQEYYPEAAFLVVMLDGEPVGRFYVARWANEVRGIDIAILPEYRNAGIGTAILKDLMAEADMSGKPLTMHVEQFNPAIRWYERLGFTRKGERGVYYLMEYRGEATKAAEPAEAADAADAAEADDAEQG